VDSTAYVTNKVEHTLLIIIGVIMCANCFNKLYKLHNKCLKKKHMSLANDLDKLKKKTQTTLIEKQGRTL